MRKFAIGYFITATLASYFMVKLQLFPATIVILWVADSDGEYIIMLAVGILLLLLLIPLLLIFLIYNLVGGKRSEQDLAVIDMAGITFSRDKALFAAMFPMEILVDGTKKASVTLGKTVHVAMPPGERTIEVRCMQRSLIQRIVIEDHHSKSYRIGLRKMSGMQDVYMDELSGDV